MSYFAQGFAKPGPEVVLKGEIRKLIDKKKIGKKIKEKIKVKERWATKIWRKKKRE